MRRQPKFAASRRKRPALRQNRASSESGRRIRRLPRLDRRATFIAYVLVAAIPILFLLVVHLSVFAHDSLIPRMAIMFWDQMVWYANAVRNRPTLLLTLPPVILFLWCFPWTSPWEALLSLFAPQSEPDNFRRGRPIRTAEAAMRQADDKRRRYRQSRRNPR